MIEATFYCCLVWLEHFHCFIVHLIKMKARKSTATRVVFWTFNSISTVTKHKENPHINVQEMLPVTINVKNTVTINPFKENSHLKLVIKDFAAIAFTGSCSHRIFHLMALETVLQSCTIFQFQRLEALPSFPLPDSTGTGNAQVYGSLCS